MMAASKEESSELSDRIEIDILVMLRRRWPHIVLGMVVGVALSAMYYVTRTPVFESQIEILVGQRSSEVTNSGTITGAGASGDAIQEDQLATHMRLLAGRKLLAAAIQQGGLKQLDSFRAATEKGKNPIDHILENLEVERGGEGSARDAMVLRAMFRDPNPDDSAIVLAAIYESYRTYVESHGQNSTEQAVRLIEDARETHESELTAADEEYRKFVQSVPVLIDGEKVQDIHKERLLNLEVELNGVRNTLAESTSRLEVIEKRHLDIEHTSGDMDHLALLSQNEVARLKLFLDVTRGETQSKEFQAEQPVRVEVAKLQYTRLLELIQKEKSLSDAFGTGHPMVEAVRQEAEIARQYIAANGPKEDEVKNVRRLDPAEMLKTYTKLLRNDIAELKKREELLVAESSRELRLAKKVEADFMKGSSLKAKLRRAQSRYDQVILRLQELKLARSYAGFSTDVLANPEPAKSPVWPNLPIIGCFGCFFGLSLGMVLALGAELLDSTITNANEMESIVGAPVIAHVPKLRPQQLIKQADKDSELDPSLVAFHTPRSAESEVYRVARTMLMSASRKDSAQTLMMTSPQPGDGKSTTISNLAICFARTEKRVLLIDADMRRPVISKMFGLESQCGLSDILSGEATLQQAVSHSEVQSLDILSNGSPTSVPAELLESHQMGKLLEEATHQYDLVLIDAPPLLAVADPSIIAPIVDSVMLTVRVRKNSRRPVEHASRILKDIGIDPLGVVINGVDKQSKSYYGYGSYSGQYDYIGQYHSQYSAVDAAPERAGEPSRGRQRGKARSARSTVPAPVHLDTSSQHTRDTIV